MDETFAFIRKRPAGGARRDRTDDLMLAKHALSQLSYGPSLSTSECRTLKEVVGLGRFELPTSRLSSARSNQLSYKPGSDDRPKTQNPRDAFQRARCEAGTGSSMKKEKRRRRRPANGRQRLRDCALMFPRDPIEMREAPLRDHP